MPACSRPATSHRAGGMSAGPGTIGLADTGEAASVAGTTQPAGMAGHAPITTDITGHGLAITEVASTIGPAGITGPEVTIGSAGIIRLPFTGAAGTARPA